MPAVSKKQQKFFGIVRAIQKGEMAPTTPETAKAAEDMKAGKKNQITGEPLYKKADHMNENLVTIENLNNVSNINVKPSAYKSEKDVIKDILSKEGYQRNPEKDPEYNKDKETFDQRRARRMKDPKRGINSPAFKKFMASQGM